jgi:hypothetical protein
MRLNNACTLCGRPGIPGLIRGAGKCQHHWNLGAYGSCQCPFCTSFYLENTMTTSNLIEQAVRAKLRFDSARGMLTVEDLFDLPLQSTRGPDLDTLARGVYHELQKLGEASFVNSRPNPAKAELQLKLDILKHVIEIKQAENAAKVQAAARESERSRLTELIARKKEAALEGEDLSVLEARLAALSGN